MKLLTRPLYYGSNGLSPISVAARRLLDPDPGFQQGGIRRMQTRPTEKFICDRKANYQVQLLTRLHARNVSLPYSSKRLPRKRGVP